MTTIAYHHESGTLAADGRLTRGALIVTDNADKFNIAQNGDILALAGDVSVCDALTESWPDVPKKKGNCRGFAVVDGCVFYVNMYQSNITKHLCSCSDAVGSGEEYALAALDLGATAREAVEAAARRDIYTGGKVREITP